MKTKSAKLLLFLGIIVLAALACGVESNLSTPLPAEMFTVTQTLPLSMIPRQPRTPTPTAFSSPTVPAATATVFPEWVANFSDPILGIVKDQVPAYADDFPAICIDERQKWKVCATPGIRAHYYQPNYMDLTEWYEWSQMESPPTLSISELPLATARATMDLEPDLRNGYSMLNRGWFYLVPDSPRNPYYAYVDFGSLILKLPTGNERRDFWVYNPKLLQKNFVLQFDLEFYDAQPKDTFRFEFDQTAERAVAFDLSKNNTWALHWGPLANWESQSGTYQSFTLKPVNIMIIANGEECAIYLDNDPLTHLSNCRDEAARLASPWAMKFHLMAETSHDAAAVIDNVKMWDLDKIPNR
jgi:hypothetical protein